MCSTTGPVVTNWIVVVIGYSGRKLKRDIANNTGSVVPDRWLAAPVFAICVDVKPAVKTAALR